MQWKVSKEESGSKLLAFLRSKVSTITSAKALKRAIETNCCQINGRIERFATTVVGVGDLIIFNDNALQNAVKASTPPAILYSDDDLLVVDKPAGQISENFNKLELVHRLDRDTTGVLIFAKHHAAKQAMIELFRSKKINKTYLAIVDGIPAEAKGEIKGYIGKICSYEGQSLSGIVTKEEGLWAETRWQVVKKGKKASLLLCVPVTGRTHQLRVHLSSIGHPILGDRQYGKNYLCSIQPNRCLLHAQSIAFPHPFTNKMIVVEADLPADFKLAMQELKL